jgi:hypothetical protein
LIQILISKKCENKIVFESSVLAWIRIRIEQKCWILIRIKSIRIHNTGYLNQYCERNVWTLEWMLPVTVLVALGDVVAQLAEATGRHQTEDAAVPGSNPAPPQSPKRGQDTYLTVYHTKNKKSQQVLE